MALCPGFGREEPGAPNHLVLPLGKRLTQNLHKSALEGIERT